MKLFHVYALTASQGTYIGKASDPQSRWKHHQYRAYQGAQWHFSAAIRKYGRNAFTLSVLFSARDESAALAAETAIIAQERALQTHLYNLTDGGEGVSGLRFSPESLARMSRAQKGLKKPPRTPEHLARLAAANRGVKRRPESVERSRQARIGMKQTAEHKARISAALRGRAAHPNTIAARKGKNLSSEHRARIAAANTGKKHSEETRAKLLARWAARRADPDVYAAHCQKISRGRQAA